MAAAPPSVPTELKPVSPYLARAHELAKAEPVISYWCASPLSRCKRCGGSQADQVARSSRHAGTYYALQQGMSLRTKDAESQAFMLGLMDKLEEVRGQSFDVGSIARLIPCFR